MKADLERILARVRHRPKNALVCKRLPWLTLLWQADGELGALVDLAGQGGFAAVDLGDRFDQAQSEAQAAIHAEVLTLPHRITGETVTITSPWPKDLPVAVKCLRRYAVR